MSVDGVGQLQYRLAFNFFYVVQQSKTMCLIAAYRGAGVNRLLDLSNGNPVSLN